MIKVILTYHKDQVSSIQITGHAQSGPYGRDIVCAGVSVASIGALNALDVLCHEDCALQMQDNRIDIQVLNHTDKVQNSLDFLRIQLETVSEQYPQSIQITRKEV